MYAYIEALKMHGYALVERDTWDSSDSVVVIYMDKGAEHVARLARPEMLIEVECIAVMPEFPPEKCQ
jgi:hypothetical protein